MTAETISSITHRLDLLAHHDACRPCASLYEYAREHQDLAALDAWRHQLALHLTAERERREYDREVLARLGAYRRARRETKVA